MSPRPLLALLCAAPAALAQEKLRGPVVGEPGSSITMPQVTAPPSPEAPGIDRGNQQPLPTLPLEAPVDPDQYVCGRGDVFELNFWGAQNFRERLTIDVEGRTFVPRIGYVELQGKTLTEARAAVRHAVQKRLPGVQFDLGLSEPRVFLVHVVGAVARPGAVEARAVERISTVLRRAGGELPNASRRHIQIERRSGARVAVDLVRYEATGDTRLNPTVLDGDVVHVPFEERTVLLSGALAQASGPDDPLAQRRMPWVPGDTVRTLLERNGGLNLNADVASGYLQSPDGKVQQLDLEALLARHDTGADRPVQPGDVIVVPWRRREVAVLGAVAKSGSFPYTPGMGVSGYLALAGGPTLRASDDVHVVSRTGVPRAASENLLPAPGDTVVVPEKAFAPNEIVQLVVSGVSLGLGAAALFIAIHR